ncbi:hypothetical protein [Nostoc sp. TCL26-01]|uniref:hypothetical protein n=1 Tax=Nostoc sp. TCL26-01 TaxID=2576904 RepID=UPI0015BDE03B|nr:hypothetical protein [Nostoc sp. TCL26-01]QLE54732.1 hypothetical protein FD725_03940 [Nostoc sp. TCL26-01]
MARAIERIEQDIAVLQEAIGAIASQLHSAYTSYLTILGQALGKQLILASYHLCTQGYPENFLQLSLNQRQQLQQSIRKLGKQAVEQLLAQLTSQEVGEIEEIEEDEEVTSVESISNSTLQVYTHNTSNPVELAKWQQHLEEETQRTLRRISHEANTILQKAKVLPKKLPEPILEAAVAASEAAAEMMPGPPNLLNLVIEVENEQDPEESSLTQIITINLRLGEIEFADPALSSERKQIRHILTQLNQLGREYQKKQKERSVAEAEAAWRSSWYED